MGEFLGGMAITLTVLAVSGVRRLVRRRRERAGKTLSYPAAWRGRRDPYPASWVAGRLVVGGGVLQLRTRDPRTSLDLSDSGLAPVRLRTLRTGERRRRREGDEQLVLFCVDGTGTGVDLVLSDAEHLQAVLGRTPARGGRPVPGPTDSVLSGLPTVLVGLGVAVLVGVTVLLGFSHRVQATVIGLDDYDRCAVEWQDASGTHDNGVDCRALDGTKVTVIALPAPLHGQVIDTGTPWKWYGVAGVLLLPGPALAGWRLARRRWAPGDPRTDKPVPMAAGSSASAAVPGVAVPGADLGVADLTWDTVVDVLVERARLEGWTWSDDVAAARVDLRRLRDLATGLSGPLTIAGFALFFALLIGWTPIAGLLASGGAHGHAVAEVAGEPEHGVPPYVTPKDATVDFTAAEGRTVETVVAVVGPVHDGDQLPVVYSLSRPERARALRHDGAPLGVAVAALLTTIGVGVLAWSLRARLGVAARQRRMLAGGPVTRTQYALAPSGWGDCVLVLAPGHPGDRPGLAVQLDRDISGKIPVSGDVELHGVVAPGQRVVPAVQGIPLSTGSRVVDLDADELLDILRGDDLDDEDDAAPAQRG